MIYELGQDTPVVHSDFFLWYLQQQLSWISLKAAMQLWCHNATAISITGPSGKAKPFFLVQKIQIKLHEKKQNTPDF